MSSDLKVDAISDHPLVTIFVLHEFRNGAALSLQMRRMTVGKRKRPVEITCRDPLRRGLVKDLNNLSSANLIDIPERLTYGTRYQFMGPYAYSPALLTPLGIR